MVSTKFSLSLVVYNLIKFIIITRKEPLAKSIWFIDLEKRKDPVIKENLDNQKKSAFDKKEYCDSLSESENEENDKHFSKINNYFFKSNADLKKVSSDSINITIDDKEFKEKI